VRISEVSRRTGVSIRSLRYYEQKRLLCAHRLENGYRDLDEEAVELRDVEHQLVVLTALHSRLTERIASLQRQLRTE